MSTPQTQVATRKDVLSFLQTDSIKKQVALALPSKMSPDRMLRVMLTTVNAPSFAGEKLRACTQESLLACLMKCSQYGLEPDGRHAHLIPFGKECTLIFDYKGLVALVRRSGEIKTIHADVVYEGDDFSFGYGSGAHLRHKPTLDMSKRGAPIASYSFVTTSTGEESFEVLPIAEVEQVRDGSQGYQYAIKNGKQSPWVDNPGEMAKKTAFRRHSKWLPLSFELKEALSADDEEARFRNAKPVSDAAMPVSYARPAEIAEPAMDLSTEVKLLSDWMTRNKIQWGTLQGILLSVDPQQGFAFADSIGSLEELSVPQAVAILGAKSKIEEALSKLAV